MAFNSEEEKNLAWGFGSLNLKPGVLRLQPWCPEFNPETHKTTNVQVWIRFYLNWIYWHPKILSDLARAVGVPLRIDGNTLNGDYGRFARLLVDIDLTEELQTVLLLNKDGKEIEVPLWYENLPFFCTECSSIGHQRASCNKLNNDHFEEAPPMSKQETFKGVARKNVWRRKELQEDILTTAVEEPNTSAKVFEKGECSKNTEADDLTEFTHYNAFTELINEDMEEDNIINPGGEGQEMDPLIYVSDSENNITSDATSEGEQSPPSTNICLDAKSAKSSRKKKTWRRGRLPKAERKKRQDKLNSGMARPMTRASSNPSQ